MQDDFEPDHAGRDPYDPTRSRRDSFGRTAGANWLIRVALVIAVIVVVRIVGGLVACSPESRADRLQSDLDAEIFLHPGANPVLSRLQNAFPGEYNQLKVQVVEATRTGATRQQIGTLASGFMQKFLTAHREDMAHAPAENLKAIREARLDLYLTLQSTADDQCAELVRTGALLGQARGLSTDARTAVTKVLTANLDAAAAGRDHPVDHGALTAADSALLSRQLTRNGLSPARTDLLSMPEKFAALPSREQCNAGIMMATAMHRLPPDVADRIDADTFRTE